MQKQPSHNPADDLTYQTEILPGVSRTFALTIPQLPLELDPVVTNAYLLCRLADTIEDDVGPTEAQKSEFHHRFVAVVQGDEPAAPFARDLSSVLSSQVLAAERELVENTERVIRVTHGFSPAERAALSRCVDIMCRGMPEFQRNKSLDGLPDVEALSRYCYYVAGVVGEMLTELFCLHSPGMARHRNELMKLAVCFGQGLQMTNILKDIWDDRRSNTCWLPRSVFADAFPLKDLDQHHTSPEFIAGLRELIGIAHRHLRHALEYTLYVPRRDRGVRRFCLWAIGMAVLTLQNIAANPTFASGDQVKISRRAVRGTVLLSNLALPSDRALRGLFAWAARGLPLAASAQAVSRPAPAAAAAPEQLAVGRR
jgi:farnesyl-diphosphate farnesyltransferase